ncbi:hypothetical protein QFC20_000432 [Naganishia adeliensis]|uniref:Uncharacterized protein n=1 Tax=Naganishia adeliensis TaxID=92952 RepID=A0ACC2X1J9_9TREE|nr:hypothetical protein QFC20_000432 [Naganishia adeliensis]
MSQPLQGISFIPAEDLHHDLAILQSSPTLLDAFLPPALRRGTITPPAPNGTTVLDHYSCETATSEESVALSRAFVDTARNGALKLVDDGPEGKLGKIGEDIEQVRSRAEQLQQSLEGM